MSPPRDSLEFPTRNNNLLGNSSAGHAGSLLKTTKVYSKRLSMHSLDAMITSLINCATSFLAGFVVFSVLGHMCFKLNTSMDKVAVVGPGLVFVVYAEAISTLNGSTFWAIIFMLMLLTLGLDSTVRSRRPDRLSWRAAS
ncbi:unnamed protein product [Protopolystoma xenopodis]|uniref:Uncharacterized protein n=1 Tax=Protopolystoma xenopodis TaxID=117903 RepID=A0A3S5FGX2_9PLAT|nr:unnamed protein product [Protopolystoma xenopodis]